MIFCQIHKKRRCRPLNERIKIYIYINSENWDAKLYYGVPLEWDYHERYCILSMPDYMTTALKNTLHQPGNNVPHTH